MKNKYEIRGKDTVVFISSPKYGEIEAILSTNMLDKVLEYGGSWGISHGYVTGKRNVGGKRQSYSMHGMIKDLVPDGMVIDHINGIKLDNRNENLRCVPIGINNMNKNGNGIWGPLGVRCVYKDFSRNGYKIAVDGVYIGYSQTLEEAITMRDTHYRMMGVDKRGYI